MLRSVRGFYGLKKRVGFKNKTKKTTRDTAAEFILVDLQRVVFLVGVKTNNLRCYNFAATFKVEF